MTQPPVYKFLPAELADRLRGFGLTVRKPVEGALQGLHRSPHLGASVEFAEYREYVPGDPVQLIDWAVYARSDRYVIRRYREETNVRGYVVLDTSGSMRFRGEGPMSKLDFACYLAAALLFILVHQGDAAALLTFDDRVRDTFQPARSFEGLRPMLGRLEALRPAGRGDLEAVLHRVAETVHARSLVVLVSDLLEPSGGLLRGLRHLQHYGHDTTVLHVLDPGELHLAPSGVTEFRDMEDGRRLLVEVDQVRDAYAHEVERYLDEVRRGCADGGAHYEMVTTSVPVEEALRGRVTRA